MLLSNSKLFLFLRAQKEKEIRTTSKLMTVLDKAGWTLKLKRICQLRNEEGLGFDLCWEKNMFKEKHNLHSVAFALTLWAVSSSFSLLAHRPEPRPPSA